MEDIDSKLLNVYCANYTRTLYYNEGDSTLPTAPTAASEHKFKQLVNSNKYTCFARGNKTCSFEEYLKSGLVAKYNSGKSLSIQKLTNCYKPSSDTVTRLDCKELAPDHYGLPVFDIKMKRVKYTEGLVHLLNYSTVLPPFNIENITLFIPDGDEQVKEIVSVSIEGEKDYDYQNNPITKVNCQHAKQDKTSRVFKDEHIINLKHFKGWILDIVVTYNHPGTTRHPRKLSAIKRQDHSISHDEANLFFDIMFGKEEFHKFADKCHEIMKKELEKQKKNIEEEKVKERVKLDELKKSIEHNKDFSFMKIPNILELIKRMKNLKYLNTNDNEDNIYLKFIVDTVNKEVEEDDRMKVYNALMSEDVPKSAQNAFREAAALIAPAVPEVIPAAPATASAVVADMDVAPATAALGKRSRDNDNDDARRTRSRAGARKKRKTKRRKTKRRKNKKLEKTYKKRRSTKNKRR